MYIVIKLLPMPGYLNPTYETASVTIELSLSSKMASSMTVLFFVPFFSRYVCCKIIASNVQQTEPNDWQAIYTIIIVLCPLYVDLFPRGKRRSNFRCHHPKVLYLHNAYLQRFNKYITSVSYTCKIANLISKLNFYKLIPYPMDNC